MGIDGHNSGDEWRAHRPECVCVGVVTTTTTIITTTTSTKGEESDVVFRVTREHRFFRSLHS